VLPEPVPLDDAVVPEDVPLDEAVLPEAVPLDDAVLPEVLPLDEAVLPEEALPPDDALPDEDAVLPEVDPPELDAEPFVIGEGPSLDDEHATNATTAAIGNTNERALITGTFLFRAEGLATAERSRDGRCRSSQTWRERSQTFSRHRSSEGPRMNETTGRQATVASRRDFAARHHQRSDVRLLRLAAEGQTSRPRRFALPSCGSVRPRGTCERVTRGDAEEGQ
jgi:hypothetical protein